MSRKTEADQIQFLLAIIEHSEKPDFEEVARSTGLYKSGKFVQVHLQGLSSLLPRLISCLLAAKPSTASKPDMALPRYQDLLPPLPRLPNPPYPGPTRRNEVKLRRTMRSMAHQTRRQGWPLRRMKAMSRLAQKKETEVLALALLKLIAKIAGKEVEVGAGSHRSNSKRAPSRWRYASLSTLTIEKHVDG